jgi:phosphoribosylformylglycinamidine synthase
MKVAILQFPGSNCDWDAEHASQGCFGHSGRSVWHKSPLPTETEAVIVPGGFSFGDYLRCGAIARFSPIMKDLKSLPKRAGKCWGFVTVFKFFVKRVLLPGALIRNDCLEFRCVNQKVKVEDSNDRFNPDEIGDELTLPIAHGEGKLPIGGRGVEKLESNGQVLLRYLGNPNGSINDIAGIRNEAGNVYGMMPHPERAVEKYHPSLDGLPILKAFLNPFSPTLPVEVSAS